MKPSYSPLLENKLVVGNVTPRLLMGNTCSSCEAASQRSKPAEPLQLMKALALAFPLAFHTLLPKDVLPSICQQLYLTPEDFLPSICQQLYLTPPEDFLPSICQRLHLTPKDALPLPGSACQQDHAVDAIVMVHEDARWRCNRGCRMWTPVFWFMKMQGAFDSKSVPARLLTPHDKLCSHTPHPCSPAS
eukprot:1156465-Pelagomonas_calceolata.AAC.2